MKITMVEPRDSGGMIHYAYNLCRALSDLGADVTLVTGPGYELHDHPHNFTVSRTWMPTAPQRSAAGPAPRGPVGVLLRRGRRAGRLLRSLVRLMREWRRQVRALEAAGPDWVLFGSIEHFVEGPFLARLRRRGMRLASIVHEPEARDGQGGLFRTIDRRMFRHVFAQFAALFAHNEVNRRRLVEIAPNLPTETVHVIEMGNILPLPPGGPADVDLRARYGIPGDAPVIVFFGTMLPSKGIGDLIDAFALVHAEHPSARLVVAGYASKNVDPGDYARQADALGIGAAVTIAPGYVPLDEVEPLIRMARVVALPYRSATQSGTMQVAYAFGRPVVATRVGGLPEVVDDGVSGYTVPPRDPVALAAALSRLVADADLAERLGAHAKHLTDTKHSWSQIAATLLTVFGASGAGGASEAQHVTHSSARA